MLLRLIDDLPRTNSSRGLLSSLILGVLTATTLAQGPQDDPTTLVQKLRQEAQAKNPQELKTRWRKVVDRGSECLPSILEQLNSAHPIEANWLCTALEAICEKALRTQRGFPTQLLQGYLANKANNPRARRLTYDWLCRFDSGARARWLSAFLNDPSPELRREAVAVELEKAEKLLDVKEEAKAKEAFHKLLIHARDYDQVNALAKHLEKLGTPVDLNRHFGFLLNWYVIGPFDNTEEKGFDMEFLPEKGVDLEAKLKGKSGVEIKWISHRTDLKYGMVDLNKAVGKHMAAVAYAYTVVESPTAQSVEIRLGSENGVHVFLNGEKLLAHEEYHSGINMDQFTIPARLKTGRNEILLKICQNNQKEEWAQAWGFQLRICDGVGTPIEWQQGAASIPTSDWPQFRGPGGTGVSAAKKIPVHWSETENLRWKARLPGKGLSNPVIAGGRVYVTACSGFLQNRLHLLCFDVKSGEKLWERQLWATGNTTCHPKTNMAAPTPATDGERVYALFATADLVCFDRDGHLLWYRALAKEYASVTNQVGMAASLVLHENCLIVPLENAGKDSFLTALDSKSGKELWTVKRPREINWTTPLIHANGSQLHVIFLSSNGLTAYDLLTGKMQWAIPEKQGSTMPSPIAAQGMIVSPSSTFGVYRPETGKTDTAPVWKSTRLRLGYCTPLVHGGDLYTLTSGGILSCWDYSTGQQKWQLRLKGPFAASPILIDGKVYTLNEEGMVQIVQPGREPKLLASNKLPGSNFLATPAVANEALFLRSDDWIYCISK